MSFGREFVHAVTDLGDPGVTLPITALIFCWLWVTAPHRIAALWCLTVITCGLIMTGLLISFHVLRDLFDPLQLRVPSGHVAGAVVAYGGIAVIAAQGQCGRCGNIALTAAAALVAAIAATRLRLGAHTVPEILAGGTVGLTCLRWFASRYRHVNEPAPRWAIAIITAGAVAIGVYGIRLDAWSIIRAAVLHIKAVLVTVT